MPIRSRADYRTSVACVVAGLVWTLLAGCSAGDAQAPRQLGARGGGCLAPSCDGCASCVAECVCATGNLQGCNAACQDSASSAGGSPGSGGSGAISGAGGIGGTYASGGNGGAGGVGGFAATGGGSGSGSGGFGASGGGEGSGGVSGSGGFAGTGGDPGSGGFAGTGADPGSGGISGTGGFSGTGGSIGGAEPRIPAPSGACPTLRTGTVQVSGQNVELWVGTRREDTKGAVFFYWHGTGSSSREAVSGLGGALDEIVREGGIVASFTTTTATGQNTGNNVWYTGDFAMADHILACATQQLNIDTRRVYTGGCSAGGLQAGAMVYGRSSYLAAAMPNSGGTIFPYQLEDPSHVPAVITTHGAAGRDVVVVDFSTTSARLYNDVVAKGGFAVNCDHGGGHCGSPADVKAAQWQFLKAHPFGVSPSPYASALPPGFPSVCRIVTR